MKPKARVKITLACNKRCKYCINNCEEYRKKWTELDQIRADQKWYRFRSIIISGGEPTVNCQWLKTCIRDISVYAGKEPMIYLQTNGFRLTKQLVKDLDDYIDGIGYSIHDMKEFNHIKTRLKDISRVKPVRLYLKDTMSSKLPLIDRAHFDIRVWEEGEFDLNEEIFVIKDNK